jgi:integrase
VSEVTSADISDLIRRVARGETKRLEKSPNKRGRIRVLGGEGAALKVASDISMVFGYAIEKRIVAANPVAGARKPKAGKRYDFLKSEELAAMRVALDELENEGANKLGTAILKLMMLTGARPAEIEGLRWSEVDVESQCLRLENSKTGYSVRPLSTVAIELIKNIPRVDNSPYVFPATRGLGHFSGSKKLWNAARKRAGLPSRVRYHARHSVASLAISEGHDIASVAALMGHSGPRTTLATYAHVLDYRVIRTANDVGRKIAEAMSRKAPLKGK